MYHVVLVVLVALLVAVVVVVLIRAIICLEIIEEEKTCQQNHQEFDLSNSKNNYDVFFIWHIGLFWKQHLLSFCLLFMQLVENTVNIK